MNQNAYLRILDANFNRAREGLRVCEEITRLAMNDAALTRVLKKTRHSISRTLKNFPVPASKLIEARDVEGDIGKKPSALEHTRRDTKTIFIANIQRVKESLRVLEEISQLMHLKGSVHFKKIRFSVYGIEKKAFPKLGKCSGKKY